MESMKGLPRIANERMRQCRLAFVAVKAVDDVAIRDSHVILRSFSPALSPLPSFSSAKFFERAHSLSLSSVKFSTLLVFQQCRPRFKVAFHLIESLDLAKLVV